MKRRTLPFFFLLTVFCAQAFAGSVALTGEVAYSEQRPGVYSVKGNFFNPTSETREIVVRAQLSFYETVSPAGDIPFSVVRKDITLIVKPNKTRKVSITLIDEGKKPKSSFRIEPMLRIRRERVWNY